VCVCVVNSQDKLEAMLCDQEVLALLKEQEEQRKKGGGHVVAGGAVLTQPQNLLTIEFEVRNYLNQMPAGVQTTPQVTAALTALKKHPLTKAERLQMINLRPTSAVEMHLVVEECEERFTEEQLDNIIQTIERTLPPLAKNNDGDNDTDTDSRIR